MASSAPFICSPLLDFIVSINLCGLSIFPWKHFFSFLSFILPATVFLLLFFIFSSFLSFSTFFAPTFLLRLNSRTNSSEGGCLCRIQARCLLISQMIERQICPQWRQEKGPGLFAVMTCLWSFFLFFFSFIKCVLRTFMMDSFVRCTGLQISQSNEVLCYKYWTIFFCFLKQSLYLFVVRIVMKSSEELTIQHNFGHELIINPEDLCPGHPGCIINRMFAMLLTPPFLEL